MRWTLLSMEAHSSISNALDFAIYGNTAVYQNTF